MRGRFDAGRFDSLRFDSLRFDSLRFDSLRFDSRLRRSLNDRWGARSTTGGALARRPGRRSLDERAGEGQARCSPAVMRPVRMTRSSSASKSPASS